MRALFGVVSLLVVLAIVGLLAVKQLGASKRAVGDAAVLAGAPPSSAASGNLRDQARQIQDQVRNDVAKALELGAAARRDEADK